MTEIVAFLSDNAFPLGILSGLVWLALGLYRRYGSLGFVALVLSAAAGLISWLLVLALALLFGWMLIFQPKFTRAIASNLGVVGELFSFLWQRRLWWLIPMVVMLVIFGLLLFFSSASGLGPFIYTLF